MTTYTFQFFKTESKTLDTFAVASREVRARIPLDRVELKPYGENQLRVVYDKELGKRDDILDFNSVNDRGILIDRWNLIRNGEEE